MIRIEESIQVDTPASFLFELIHDYSLRLNWDPFLRQAAVIDHAGKVISSAPRVGQGSRVRCSAHYRSGGAVMDVEYISFQRPRTAAVRMVRGPWYFRRFVARMTTSAISETETLLTALYQFETVLPWILCPAIGFILKSETTRRWVRLKAFAERMYNLEVTAHQHNSFRRPPQGNPRPPGNPY